MNDPERPAFGASEVIEITSKLEADDNTFIIGGQATNFWAWFYQDKEPALKLKGPFTSADIDYFGTQEVARNLANALGGKLLLPDLDHHTPNTAQIETTINGKPLKIDFLREVLGVQDRELQRGVSILEITAELAGKPTTVRIKVMHPVLCLKSRIVSMLHPATRRTDRVARTQAEAAIVIVQRFISETLDEADGRNEAKACIREIFRYLRTDQYVKVADIKIGIDPLTILRAFADDQRIERRYRNRQIKPMIAKIEQRRKNRRMAQTQQREPIDNASRS
jgi:hypothetical protein